MKIGHIHRMSMNPCGLRFDSSYHTNNSTSKQGASLNNSTTMIQHIIAIDPDVDKSGVAFLHLPSRELHCEAKTFPELIDDLHATKQATDALREPLIVIVEAGWLNRSNWHVQARDSRRKAAAIGRAAGRNHEVGRKIVEMARHMGIEVVEQRPLQKCWRGTGRKITHEELAAFTGYTARTSQDMRDAALLAWVYAGLPIRLSP